MCLLLTVAGLSLLAAVLAGFGLAGGVAGAGGVQGGLLSPRLPLRLLLDFSDPELLDCVK